MTQLVTITPGNDSGRPIVELVVTPDNFIGVKYIEKPTNQQMIEGAITMILMVAQDQQNPQAFIDKIVSTLNGYYTIPLGGTIQ